MKQIAIQVYPNLIYKAKTEVEFTKGLIIVNFNFSGNETKLGMSRGVPEPKLTSMDAMIDKLTGAIFLFQIAVVVVLGSAGNVWKDTEARKVLLFNCCR